MHPVVQNNDNVAVDNSWRNSARPTEMRNNEGEQCDLVFQQIAVSVVPCTMYAD